MKRGGGTLLAALAVAALTLVVQWPAVHARAEWIDDTQYLNDNPLVRNPSLASAGRFLSEVLSPSTVQGYYQPLSMISLMLDVAMGGSPENPLQFHRTSLLLHALNAALVLLVVRGLLSAGAPKTDKLFPPSTNSGSPFRTLLPAVFVAILFGLHPLTVECLVWVSERKTPLATSFALLSLLAYLRYVRTRRPAMLMLTGVMYCVALLAKPTVVPLPILMLILDYWPLGREVGAEGKSARMRVWLHLLIEKAPLLVLTMLFAVITYVSQARTAAVTVPREGAVFVVPIMLAHNIVFYLAKFVWPTNLVPYYVGPASISFSEPMMAAGLIGAVLLIVMLVVSVSWTRAFVVSWLFWFVAILPTMGIVGFTGVIASDKYMYFPMLGFLIGIAFLVRWLMDRTAGKQQTVVAVLAVVFTIVAGLESRQSRRTIAAWSDTDALMLRVLEAQPRAGVVHNNYGIRLARRGQHSEAAKHYLLAMEHNPEYEHPYHNLASLLVMRDRPDEAIPLYRKALDLKPDYVDALLNLGNLLYKRGERDEARRLFERAIAAAPQRAAGYNNLAGVLAGEGKWPEAIQNYEEALHRQPDYPEAMTGLAGAELARGNRDRAMQLLIELTSRKPAFVPAQMQLGDLYLQQGRIDDAGRCYRAILAIDVNNAVAHNNLANVLMGQKRFDEALAETREAVRLDANYANARFNLATLLLQAGQAGEAIPAFEKALQLRPQFAKGHHYLGVALEQLGRIDEAISHYEEALRIDPQYAPARQSLDAVAMLRHNTASRAAGSQPANRPETSPWTKPSK